MSWGIANSGAFGVSSSYGPAWSVSGVTSPAGGLFSCSLPCADKHQASVFDFRFLRNG